MRPTFSHGLLFLVFLVAFFPLSAQQEQTVVTIELSPKKVTLYPGQEYRFVARGLNRYDKEVPFTPEWSATGGTIKDGVYKAGTNAGVYTIMATDPNTGAQGSSAVVIKFTSPEEESLRSSQTITRLEIYPKKVQLKPKGTVKFIVQAFNARNEQIRLAFQPIWKVTGGSISVDGEYVAGSPGSYMVRVQEPNGVMTSAEVIVEGSTGDVGYVKIFPSEASLKPLEQKRFFLTAYNTSGNVVSVKYRWEATGGSIDDNGIYNAGSKPGTYFIKAVTPLGISSTATVVIEKTKIARISVSPNQAVLYPGQIQKFDVKAYDTGGNEVTAMPLWSASGGDIHVDGTYLAGTTPGNYLISITVDNISVERSVIIKPGEKPARIVVKPEDPVVKPGQIVQFQAEAYDREGKLVSTEIEWRAGGGEISPSGVYRAGNTPGQFVVRAIGGSLSGEANVSIGSKSVHIPVSRITIEPSEARLAPGERVQFKARAFHRSNQEVPCALTWSATGGSIGADGTYIAGDEVGNYEVTASTNTGVKATAGIVVYKSDVKRAAAVKLVVNPDHVSLNSGESCKFHVALFDENENPVPGRIQWQATGGQINTSGHYTAGQQAGRYSVLVTDLSSGINQKVEVEIKAPKTESVKLEPVRILRWRSGEGSELTGSIYIEGRVYADNPSYVKLILVLNGGGEKLLAEVPISKGEKFTFRGEYTRSTTQAIAIILIGINGEALYRFERPS